MSKFKVGDKVRVTVNNPENSRVIMEDVLTISEYLGTDSLGENYKVNGRWYIHGKYLEAVTLPAKEITLNGATYVLKEEPKPDHEWKFGDVATHPDYGVGMVFSEPDEDNDVMFAYNGDWDWADIKDLTFLRRADLSV